MMARGERSKARADAKTSSSSGTPLVARTWSRRSAITRLRGMTSTASCTATRSTTTPAPASPSTLDGANLTPRSGRVGAQVTARQTHVDSALALAWPWTTTAAIARGERHFLLDLGIFTAMASRSSQPWAAAGAEWALDHSASSRRWSALGVVGKALAEGGRTARGRARWQGQR